MFSLHMVLDGSLRMKPSLSALGILALLCIVQARAATCNGVANSQTIKVPGHPFAVVPSADNCWLFVSLETGNERGAVGVLHNQAGQFTLVRTVDIPRNAFGESLARDGATLFVAAGADTAVLDVAMLERGDAGALLGLLRNGRGGGAIYAAVSPDDKTLFVTDEDKRRISVFDLVRARASRFREGEPIGHIKTAYAPVGLAFSPDGRWLYATNEVGPAKKGHTCPDESHRGYEHAPGVLVIVDARKAATDPEHALAGALVAGCNPVRVAASPDGKWVWVTARGSNKLLRFQMDEWPAQADHIVSTSFDIGVSPVGIAVRPDGRQVWVALSNRFGDDEAGQLVGLEDTTQDSPAKLLSAPAKGFPREVSFLPDNRTVAVTLFNANQVELIPTPD